MARISELHYSNAFADSTGIAEFVEVALEADDIDNIADYSIALYEADGTVGAVISLADVPAENITFDTDANEWVIVISGDAVDGFDFQITDPDSDVDPDTGQTIYEAVALVNTDTDEVINFYDIGGGTTDITAVDGPAAGETSVNLSPENADPDLVTSSIQFLEPESDVAVFAELSPGDSGAVCFGRGAMIRTASGDKPVESLEVGDLVMTKDHGAQPIRWIGRRTAPAKGAFAPVVIDKGVFGAERTLEVSQQHRVLISGPMAELMMGEAEVLVAAKHLTHCDGVHLRQSGVAEFFHMLFDRHEVVMSNGVWTESLHPQATALATLQDAAREEVLTLFPELREGAESFPAARAIARGHEAKVLLGA